MADLQLIHVFDQNVAAAADWMAKEDNGDCLEAAVFEMMEQENPDEPGVFVEYCWPQVVGLAILGLQYMQLRRFEIESAGESQED